jgi:hypothetical protein
MAGLALRFLAEDVERGLTVPRLRETMLREAQAGIAWACEALGLDAPIPREGVLPAGPWRP